MTKVQQIARKVRWQIREFASKLLFAMIFVTILISGGLAIGGGAWLLEWGMSREAVAAEKQNTQEWRALAIYYEDMYVTGRPIPGR